MSLKSIQPLKHIRVEPLASESLGVRSMCLYVETKDVKAILDPGVSLGPRFRRLPHPREYKALEEARRRIRCYASKAYVATVSHYHYDHITPPFESDWVWTWSNREECAAVYSGKLMLVKNIRRRINLSQRQRGWILQKFTREIAERIEVCDGKTFEFGDTVLRFSEPVPHGEEGSLLGWVLMVTVESRGEKLIYCSDVQGPMSSKTLELILAEKPDMVVVGGPPLYLAGFRVRRESIERGLENLAKIVSKTRVTVVDHHLLRDRNWKEVSKQAFSEAVRHNHALYTAAGLLGLEERLLEAYRAELYEREPPSREFIKWTKLPADKRRRVRPPV